MEKNENTVIFSCFTVVCEDHWEWWSRVVLGLRDNCREGYFIYCYNNVSYTLVISELRILVLLKKIFLLDFIF